MLQWSQLDRGTEKASISTNRVTALEWNFAIGPQSDLFYALLDLPTKLIDVTDNIFQGLVTSADKVYILERAAIKDGLVHGYSPALDDFVDLEPEVVHPVMKGAVHIRRYGKVESDRYVIFPYKDGQLISAIEFTKQFPKTWAYLNTLREQLENREKGKMKHDKWYAYVYPKSLTLFEKQKILVPSIGQKPEFTYDFNGEAYLIGSGGGGGGGYGIIKKSDLELDYLYILGILNSNLTNFFMRLFSSPFREGWFAYNKQYIEQIPIRTINFDDPADKARHDRMVGMVERMLQLKQDHAAAEAGLLDSRHELAQQIERLDGQIDALVYELYGLTDDEIAIVEG